MKNKTADDPKKEGNGDGTGVRYMRVHHWEDDFKVRGTQNDRIIQGVMDGLMRKKEERQEYGYDMRKYTTMAIRNCSPTEKLRFAIVLANAMKEDPFAIVAANVCILSVYDDVKKMEAGVRKIQERGNENGKEFKELRKSLRERELKEKGPEGLNELEKKGYEALCKELMEPVNILGAAAAGRAPPDLAIKGITANVKLRNALGETWGEINGVGTTEVDNSRAESFVGEMMGAWAAEKEGAVSENAYKKLQLYVGMRNMGIRSFGVLSATKLAICNCKPETRMRFAIALADVSERISGEKGRSNEFVMECAKLCTWTVFEDVEGRNRNNTGVFFVPIRPDKDGKTVFTGDDDEKKVMEIIRGITEDSAVPPDMAFKKLGLNVEFMMHVRYLAGGSSVYQVYVNDHRRGKAEKPPSEEDKGIASRGPWVLADVRKRIAEDKQEKEKKEQDGKDAEEEWFSTPCKSAFERDAAIEKAKESDLKRRVAEMQKRKESAISPPAQDVKKEEEFDGPPPPYWGLPSFAADAREEKTEKPPAQDVKVEQPGEEIQLIGYTGPPGGEAEYLQKKFEKDQAEKKKKEDDE